MKKYKSVLYVLEDISEGGEKAFKAILPSLGNGVVFGNSMEEIEKGIGMALEYESELKKSEGYY